MHIFINHLNRIIGWVILRLEGRHENGFRIIKRLFALAFIAPILNQDFRCKIRFLRQYEIIDEIFTDNP